MKNKRGFTPYHFPFKSGKGFTLIEIIVAVGLFAVVMTLASGAYLIMINVNRHAQAMATGIDNLSFALETMTRTIRTGTNYNNGFDCPTGCTSFSVLDSNGNTKTYALSANNTITQTQNGNGVDLTDPSVKVNSLTFYAYGTSNSDNVQPRVTIIVSGTVSSGPGRTVPFTVETGATMRGTDI